MIPSSPCTSRMANRMAAIGKLQSVGKVRLLCLTLLVLWVPLFGAMATTAEGFKMPRAAVGQDGLCRSFGQTTDSDGDGVTDEQEAVDGTDPNNFCSFVLASATVTPYASWYTEDCDNDGLSNQEEVDVVGTDPLSADTDGDGIDDGQEFFLDNTSPLNGCSSNGGTPPQDSDCDVDGLTLGEEGALGTDPNSRDSDGDGIGDGQEVDEGTDPLNPCVHIGGATPTGLECGVNIAKQYMSPNADGVNEVLLINNIESFPDNRVEIFNRWGVRVFNIYGYDNDQNVFTGISNGRAVLGADNTLPAGVYFYVINYTENGGNATSSGYLYLNQ